MLITENQLRIIIRDILTESKKLPSEGGKMFDDNLYVSEPVQSGSEPNTGMTLIYNDGNNAYFLLTRGSKNKDKQFGVIKDIKDLAWSADIDEYDDYSQEKFAQHAKEGRIVYKKQGMYGVKKEKLDTGFNVASAVDMAYDTLVDGGAAALSLFPATAAAATGANIAQGLKKLGQGRILEAALSFASAIPVTSAGVASLGSLARNPQIAKGMAHVLLEFPGLLKGVQDLNNALKDNKSEMVTFFDKETKGKVAKGITMGTSTRVAELMYDSLVGLVNRILDNVED